MPYTPTLPSFQTSDPGGTDMSAAFAQGRKIQGQNALASALSASTDANGNVDPTAIQANAIQGGNPLAIIQAQEAAQGVIANQNAAQELHAKSIQYGTQAIGALPDDASLDDVHGAIDNYSQLMGQNGTPISPQFAATLKNQATQADAKSPTGLKGYIDNMRALHQSAQEQINYRQGQPSLINTGGTLNPVVIGGMGSAQPGGVTSAGGGIPLSMSPEAANDPVNIPQPNGQTIITTRGRFLGGLPSAASANPLATATDVAPVAPGGGAPNGGNMLSDNIGAMGTINNAVQPAGARPAAGTPQAVASQFGGVVTGTPLGAADEASLSARSFQGDLSDAANLKQATYPAQEAIGLLDKVKTGAGADTLHSAAQIIASIEGPGSKAYEYATNADKLSKYLTQNASSAAAQNGPQTDMNLATTISGKPNTHLTDLANSDVAKAQVGLQRTKAALPLLAQQLNTQAAQQGQAAPVPASEYNSWKAQAAQTLDPRGFMTDYLTPAQVQAIPGYNKQNPSQSTGDAAKVIHSFNIAHSLGLVDGIGTKLNK